MEAEMKRFRAVEATSIRLEEANRCAREMKQARADMDRWHEQARAGSACRGIEVVASEELLQLAQLGSGVKVDRI